MYAKALAKLVGQLAVDEPGTSDHVDVSVYLVTGAVVTAATWTYDESCGLLTFEGLENRVHIVNPAAIVAAHVGRPSDADPAFLMKVK